jgi:hypothetical protein
MSIKDKPLKKCHSDKRVTIDVLHSNICGEFNNNKHKKKKIKKKILQEKNNLLNHTINDKEYINISQKINKYTEELNKYSDTTEHDYYFDNALILNSYYNGSYKSNIHSNTNKEESKNILSYFSCGDDDSDNSSNTINNDIHDTNLIEDDINIDDILVQYMSNINDDYINENYKDDNNTLHICPKCNINMYINNNENQIYCNQCGYTNNIMINTEKCTFKDLPREISYFAYKRINHFNEWLAQFQAKETTDIPTQIYTDVHKEFKKNKNINIKELNYKQVREVLKKLKYNKYYEHIPSIITVITGKKAPVLYPQYEEKLRNMFKEIQTPFMKHCPETRKNFLSYSYVLHKFCELLELDDLLIYFPLLKSREKLQQQDYIWKNICNELDWQYIPSV